MALQLSTSQALVHHNKFSRSNKTDSSGSGFHFSLASISEVLSIDPTHVLFQDILASWWAANELYSNNNVWLIQVGGDEGELITCLEQRRREAHVSLARRRACSEVNSGLERRRK
jgi:hypothetical protein